MTKEEQDEQLKSWLQIMGLGIADKMDIAYEWIQQEKDNRKDILDGTSKSRNC